MGLLTRIFGNSRSRDAAGPQSSQFHESESTSNEGEGSRNAPRRELVQVTMRDTMRKHGIPTDWMECRILSTVNRSGRAGLHANFVVKQAHQQMLSYVFAFQESFETELVRFEPRARDWLMAMSWEFENLPPGLAAQTAQARPSAAAPLGALSAGSGLPQLRDDFQARAFAPTDDAMAAEMPRSDEEVQRDLQALFAIRDAAMAQAAKRDEPGDAPDFENTRPFDDDEPPGKKG